MGMLSRFSAAWRALTGSGQRSDAYAGVYGNGATGGFAGGAVGRLTASLATWSGSINVDNDIALPVLRARARDLAANNEYGKRFLSLVAMNVVGRKNPKLQVRALRDQRNPDKPTTLDKSANDCIELHWDRWGRTCDISGKHRSLYSLSRAVVKSVARDGEALVRKIRNRKLPYGMALQHIEADRLDEARNLRLDNGNMIRQGVEIDSAGRAVAYWIKTTHPGDSFAMTSPYVERVPAQDVVHLFLPERAEQVRGVTWFHAVIIRGARIDRFETAALVAAEIGASKVAALERADDGPEVTMADSISAGIPQMKVEAGEMFELPPGYKLNSWNPEYPHANFESFLKTCLRGLSAGFDVAAHNLTGDMTDVNYSSARIAELSERETWMVLQDWFIEQFTQPIYEEWLAISLLAGAITFDISGSKLPPDKLQKFLNASRFQGRRWSWVDPSKEADANEKMIAAGLTSRTRIAAEQGEEFDDIIDELKQETAQLKEAGIPLILPGKALAEENPPAPPPTDPAVTKAMALMMTRLAEPTAPPPAAPQITVSPVIHTPAVRVENTVAVPEAAPPVVQVDVAAPAVTVAPAAVEVRVDAVMPEPAAPVVEVNVQMPEETRTTITAMPARETTTRIDRNMAGEITASAQVERDIQE